MSGRYVYPFTAIVGQERMQLALLLHAINPRLGGLLIRGEKGTAKSTAVRALANLLPNAKAIEGCPFGCDPDSQDEQCESCARLISHSGKAPGIPRPVPVVELPIGATEDRVLGSLDLEHAIKTGERRFEPGLLARANRGILYVDEVNLLGDHLVDVLLDAAALGWNYVEREGVSFSHPASFMLIGTMNPEEGDLRPQLLDRFALAVEVRGLGDPAQRAEVVRRRIAFEADPAGFCAAQASHEEQERERLARARSLLPAVAVPESALNLIVRICAAFEVDGLRCDLAIYRAATTLAAYHGRTVVEPGDVRLAAELALPHRRRRQPFEQSGLDQDRLNELLNEDPVETNGSSGHCDHGAEGATGRIAGSATGATQISRAARSPQPQPSANERIIEPAGPLEARLPRPAKRRGVAAGQGRRPAKRHDRDGAPEYTTQPSAQRFELAVAASLRAAAPYQALRRASGTGPFLRLSQSDLRERIRQGRTSALVLFLVDASGSMGARQRMQYAKAATAGLLQDAYRKRDRVAMIAFRGDQAELLVPPTNSVELAERRLRFLPTGGRTPLARGLELARETIDRAVAASKPLSPVLILVSDGKANVGMGGGSGPWPDAVHQAKQICDRGWPALVVDASGAGPGAGLGRALATALGATVLSLNPVTRTEGRA